eukprot:ANDGO_03236.mRNA.1 Exocyst complex component SEC3A
MATLDTLLAPIFLDVHSAPHFLAACRVYKAPSVSAGVSSIQDRKMASKSVLSLTKFRILVLFRDKKDQRVRLAKLKPRTPSDWAGTLAPPLTASQKEDIVESFTTDSKKAVKGSHICDLVGSLDLPEEVEQRLHKEVFWRYTHSSKTVTDASLSDEMKRRALSIVFRNKKPLRLVCAVQSERDSFVSCILSFVESQISIHGLAPSVALASTDVAGSVTKLSRVSADTPVRALLSESDSRDLENLLSSDVSDLEASVLRLSQDLSSLESANIHSILSSESTVKTTIVKPLDSLVLALDDTSAYLDLYSVKLHVLGQDMAAIESRNNMLQVRAANHSKLKKVLDGLLEQIRIDDSYRKALSGASKMLEKLKAVFDSMSGSAAPMASVAAVASRALEQFTFDDDDEISDPENGSEVSSKLFGSNLMSANWYNDWLYPKDWTRPRPSVPLLPAVLEGAVDLQKKLDLFHSDTAQFVVEDVPICYKPFLRMDAVQSQLEDMAQLLNLARGAVSRFLVQSIDKDVLDFSAALTKKKAKDVTDLDRPLKNTIRWKKYMLLVPLLESLRRDLSRLPIPKSGELPGDMDEDHESDSYAEFRLDDDGSTSDGHWTEAPLWVPIDPLITYASPISAVFKKDIERLFYAFSKKFLKPGRKDSDLGCIVSPSKGTGIPSPWGNFTISPDCPELHPFSVVLVQTSNASLDAAVVANLSSIGGGSGAHKRTRSDSSDSTVADPDFGKAEDRLRPDEAFSLLLSDLSFSILGEYTFLGIFLHGYSLVPLVRKQFPPVAFKEIEGFLDLESTRQTLEKVDPLIDVIFVDGVRSSLHVLIDYFEKKVNRFFAIRMLDDLRSRLIEAQKKNLVGLSRVYTEIQLSLRNVLNTVVDKMCDQVKLYGMPVKRVGLAPYVVTFGSFMEYLMTLAYGDKRGANEDESIVCDIITKYGRIMLDRLRDLASADLKYGDTFLLENLYFFSHSLGSRFKVSLSDCRSMLGKDEVRTKSKARPPSVLLRYMIESFEVAVQSRDKVVRAQLSHRFGKVVAFFEGVDKLLSQGFPPEEVAFQLEFSRQKLTEAVLPLIQNKSVVEQAVKELRDRMFNKHITSGKLYSRDRKQGTVGDTGDWNSDVQSWVWEKLRVFMCDSLKTWERIVERCYPGVKFPVRPEDVRNVLTNAGAFDKI